MRNRMIVISLDAVGGRDMEFMRTLPNFRRLFGNAAVCEHVKSVYPTLTYPAHTSIVTGRYPVHHGIVNNTKIQPGREKPDWYWHRKHVKTTTLYDEAANQGMRCAALLWPVTAGAGIMYNLPEIWANRSWQNQMAVSFFYGSKAYEFALQTRFGYLRDGIKQPMLDNFVQSSLLYTLQVYKPDLTLVHLTDVDTNRHMYGVEHEEIKKALRRHDRRIGELLDKLEELGMDRDTNLVVLGDHCQIDSRTIIYPNYIFRRKGWISVKDNRLAGWKVWSHNCDGSCYIYLKNREDRQLKKRVADLLKMMSKDPRSGIEKIYTGTEAAKMGADWRCSFMVEAKPGYFFQDGFERFTEPVKPYGFMEKSCMQMATHGYHPDKPDYETIFVGTGPDFRPGARCREMSLVDEGPTMARILGLDLGDTDGHVVEELLCHSTL